MYSKSCLNKIINPVINKIEYLAAIDLIDEDFIADKECDKIKNILFGEFYFLATLIATTIIKIIRIRLTTPIIIRVIVLLPLNRLNPTD